MKLRLRKGSSLTFSDKSKAAGNAPISDPSAWMGGSEWGAGLLGQSKKPMTAEQYLEYFTGWAYIAAMRNAEAVASAPYGLYVRKDEKGKKFKTITTRTISNKKKDYIFNKPALARYLKTAEDVEEVVEHPFLDLINTVNDFCTASHLWETTTLFLDLTGEAYWFLVKDRKLGIPREIWSIPSHVCIQREWWKRIPRI